MAKTMCRIEYIQKTEAARNGDKDRISLQKLMNNVGYGNTMGNVRNILTYDL